MDFQGSLTLTRASERAAHFIPWLASPSHTLQWSEIYQRYILSISLILVQSRWSPRKRYWARSFCHRRLLLKLSQKKRGPFPLYTKQPLEYLEKVQALFSRPVESFKKRYSKINKVHLSKIANLNFSKVLPLLFSILRTSLLPLLRWFVTKWRANTAGKTCNRSNQRQSYSLYYKYFR